MARLATRREKLVASGPNPVALATPQVATSSPALGRSMGSFPEQWLEIKPRDSTGLGKLVRKKGQKFLPSVGGWEGVIFFGITQ